MGVSSGTDVGVAARVVKPFTISQTARYDGAGQRVETRATSLNLLSGKSITHLQHLSGWEGDLRPRLIRGGTRLTFAHLPLMICLAAAGEWFLERLMLAEPEAGTGSAFLT